MKNYKLLFMNTLLSNNLQKQVGKVYPFPFVVAQQNLEKSILKGFEENAILIEAYSMPNNPYYLISKDKIQHKINEQVSEKTISKTFFILKLPIIRYIVNFFSALHIIIRFGLSKGNKKVFLTSNFLVVSIPILLVSKLLHIEVTCLLCDLVTDLYEDNISCFRKLFRKLTVYVESKFDKYIFISEKMNEQINATKYIVIEGIYNDNLAFKRIEKKNIFIYSGSLIEKYGISKIIEVFKELNLEDYELHIYGEGVYKEEMLKSIEGFDNIKYKGFINREELFTKLCEAKYLMNLRNPNDEYTKYSFPSKLFEYFASESLIISTKLEGMPSEYDDYMVFLSSYDTKSICNDIKSIMMNYKNKSNIGVEARQFILNNKTYKPQTKKIIEFLERSD